MVEAKSNGEKEVDVWGTGTASREFLYVEDAAEGIIKATELCIKSEPVNLGTRNEITIKDLVFLISELADFKGNLIWDTLKPDGQPRRRLDIERARKRILFQNPNEFKGRS